jgi:hypothetical protein
MKRSKALAVTLPSCLVLLVLGSISRATDVVWKGVTYHDASITSVDGDRVTISGMRDPDEVTASVKMPLSNVPDEVIQAYRTNHDPAGKAVAERPLSPKEAAAVKAQLAARNSKLANLKAALARDPYHPVIVAGHILLKDSEGVVITCDAATPADLPQSAGTIFLKDCPGAQKMAIGDPIAAVGYNVGQHIYNFQKIQAFSIHPAPPQTPDASPPSTGSTPASSP